MDLRQTTNMNWYSVTNCIWSYDVLWSSSWHHALIVIHSYNHTHTITYNHAMMLRTGIWNIPMKSCTYPWSLRHLHRNPPEPRNLARNLVLKLHRIAPELIWAKDPIAKFCCWGKTPAIPAIPFKNPTSDMIIMISFPLLYWYGVFAANGNWECINPHFSHGSSGSAPSTGGHRHPHSLTRGTPGAVDTAAANTWEPR